jgi:hypothetical protein
MNSVPLPPNWDSRSFATKLAVLLQAKMYPPESRDEYLKTEGINAGTLERFRQEAAARIDFKAPKSRAPRRKKP